MSLTFSHFTLDNESINSHLAIISIPVAASLSNEVTAHWINVKHLELVLVEIGASAILQTSGLQ